MRTTEPLSAIDLDGIRAIRNVLIVGLASFGEIERLNNACEIQTIGGK